MKVDETLEIKERTCTRSCAQYQSTNHMDWSTNTLYSRLSWPTESWGSESCQSSRLVFGPRRLIPWPSQLMSGLAVSLSGSVQDSSWIQVFFILRR